MAKSKKKVAPKSDDKTYVDNLRDAIESRRDEVNKIYKDFPVEGIFTGTSSELPVLNFKDKEAYVKDWRDVIEGRSELANKNYKLVECELVLPSTNLIQEDAKTATKCSNKCSNKNCCKDEIKMLRKELSDLRRSYNGYKGAMKQADNIRDSKVRGLIEEVSVLKRQLACMEDSGLLNKVKDKSKSIDALHNRTESIFKSLYRLSLKEDKSTYMVKKYSWAYWLGIVFMIIGILIAYFK